MERKFKELIKEAVLEALIEFTTGGVATLGAGDAGAPEQAPQVDDPNGGETGGETGGEDESGKGGASEESSGGGTFGDGRPKPDVGVGVFSLRNKK